MTVSRLAIVFVVLLILTAGCSGFLGGDSSPDREQDGNDDQENLSVDEIDDTGELPPGLTTEGLTNPDDLREAHHEAIGNQSYTLVREGERVIESGNESLRTTREQVLYIDPEAEVAYEVNHYRYEGNTTISDEFDRLNRTVKRWFGEERVSMVEYENGTVEYTPSRPDIERAHDRINETRTDRAWMRVLGAPQDPERTTVSVANGEQNMTYYALQVRENASDDVLRLQKQEFESRILIREDGLVRQKASEDLYVDAGNRTIMNRTAEITDIGETTVERPDWYMEAIEAVPDDPNESSELEGLKQEDNEMAKSDSTGVG